MRIFRNPQARNQQLGAAALLIITSAALGSAAGAQSNPDQDPIAAPTTTTPEPSTPAPSTPPAAPEEPEQPEQPQTRQPVQTREIGNSCDPADIVPAVAAAYGQAADTLGGITLQCDEANQVAAAGNEEDLLLLSGQTGIWVTIGRAAQCDDPELAANIEEACQTLGRRVEPAPAPEETPPAEPDETPDETPDEEPAEAPPSETPDEEKPDTGNENPGSGNPGNGNSGPGTGEEPADETTEEETVTRGSKNTETGTPSRSGESNRTN